MEGFCLTGALQQGLSFGRAVEQRKAKSQFRASLNIEQIMVSGQVAMKTWVLFSDPETNYCNINGSPIACYEGNGEWL